MIRSFKIFKTKTVSTAYVLFTIHGMLAEQSTKFKCDIGALAVFSSLLFLSGFTVQDVMRG
jgi:hypothetical protein